MNDKGSTLIECIISINIIVLCVFVLCKVFALSNIYINKTKERLEALNIAQNYMENIKNCDIDDISMYKNAVFNEKDFEIDTNLDFNTYNVNSNCYLSYIDIYVDIENNGKEVISFKGSRKIR